MFQLTYAFNWLAHDPTPSDAEYCCEDEIVQNGADGFDAGETIEGELFNNCTEFEFSIDDKDNLSVKLTSWNEKTVSSEWLLIRITDFRCPSPKYENGF